MANTTTNDFFQLIRGPQGRQGISGDSGNTGEDGSQGMPGINGQPGFSPEITLVREEISEDFPNGGVTITVTHKDGSSTSATISNGEKGAAGDKGDPGEPEELKYYDLNGKTCKEIQSYIDQFNPKTSDFTGTVTLYFRGEHIFTEQEAEFKEDVYQKKTGYLNVYSNMHIIGGTFIADSYDMPLENTSDHSLVRDSDGNLITDDTEVIPEKIVKSTRYIFNVQGDNVIFENVTLKATTMCNRPSIYSTHLDFSGQADQKRPSPPSSSEGPTDIDFLSNESTKSWGWSSNIIGLFVSTKKNIKMINCHCDKIIPARISQGGIFVIDSCFIDNCPMFIWGGGPDKEVYKQDGSFVGTSSDSDKNEIPYYHLGTITAKNNIVYISDTGLIYRYHVYYLAGNIEFIAENNQIYYNGSIPYSDVYHFMTQGNKGETRVRAYIKGDYVKGNFKSIHQSHYCDATFENVRIRCTNKGPWYEYSNYRYSSFTFINCDLDLTGSKSIMPNIKYSQDSSYKTYPSEQISSLEPNEFKRSDRLIEGRDFNLQYPDGRNVFGLVPYCLNGVDANNPRPILYKNCLIRTDNRLNQLSTYDGCRIEAYLLGSCLISNYSTIVNCDIYITGQYDVEIQSSNNELAFTFRGGNVQTNLPNSTIYGLGAYIDLTGPLIETADYKYLKTFIDFQVYNNKIQFLYPLKYTSENTVQKNDQTYTRGWNIDLFYPVLQYYPNNITSEEEFCKKQPCPGISTDLGNFLKGIDDDDYNQLKLNLWGGYETIIANNIIMVPGKITSEHNDVKDDKDLKTLFWKYSINEKFPYLYYSKDGNSESNQEPWYFISQINLNNSDSNIIYGYDPGWKKASWSPKK